MESTYWITSGEKSLFLFSLNYEYKSEEPVIFDLEAKLNKKRDLSVEDTIRNLYWVHTKRYSHASSPIVLLKLLLANGFDLKCRNDQSEYTLSKDHFPIKYETRSDKTKIRFGVFYRTSTMSADDQFPIFGEWLDNLCGVRGMTKAMTCQFVAAGFSLVATDKDTDTTLITSDQNGNILSGREATLKYLFDEKA
jgi:hypothetical protein